MSTAASRAARRALAGWLLAACCAAGAQAPVAAEPLLGKPAPQFVVADLSHRQLDLNALRGKVVLLNFWATWCAPCQLEMPRFAAWQSQYGPRGLQVVGISMDDDPAPVLKTLARLRLNYPVAMGDEKLGDLYGGVLGLPVTYLIDARGEIRAVFRGAAELGAMEERIKTLLPRE